MNVAAHVLVGLVVALHAYFLVLEMFLWTTPFGQKTLISACELLQELADSVHSSVAVSHRAVAKDIEVLGQKVATLGSFLQAIDNLDRAYWDSALRSGRCRP